MQCSTLSPQITEALLTGHDRPNLMIGTSLAVGAVNRSPSCVGKTVILFVDSHNTVISFELLFLSLFTFDNSNDLALQYGARECRLILQYNHVGGIAICVK